MSLKKSWERKKVEFSFKKEYEITMAERGENRGRLEFIRRVTSEIPTYARRLREFLIEKPVLPYLGGALIILGVGLGLTMPSSPGEIGPEKVRFIVTTSVGIGLIASWFAPNT